MLRPCLGLPGKPCRAFIPSGQRCDACERRRRDRWNREDVIRRGTSAQRGYGWPWPRIRRQVLEEEHACRSCGRSDVPLQVDHIIALPPSGNGTSDRSNLQALCRSCHMYKTRAHGKKASR